MSPAFAGLLLALHALASTIWVGGMFFAYMALRPVAASVLDPPQRLPLWAGTLAHFFAWVGGSVIVLLATGFALIFGYYGSMAAVGGHVHTMLALGLIMMALFLYVYFLPYRSLNRAVDAADWPEGARQLARIRRMVAINLILGLLTVCIGAGGRWFW